MGLDTNNAGAVVAGGSSNGGARTYKVTMLIGTYVKSLGKDVKEGAVVEISDVDYRFLKPYGYCEDYKAEAVEVAIAPPADNSNEGGAENNDGDNADVEAPKTPVEGKRKNR